MELFKKKKLSSVTSLLRHHDVIIIQFSMYIGLKLKTLYLWNSAIYKICSYIVGKHLPSSKRWFIIGMDMSVPDREISVLNSTKIPEKSEKSKFFVGGPKISIFENCLVFYMNVMEMSNFIKFIKMYAFLRILQPFIFFVFL